MTASNHHDGSNLTTRDNGPTASGDAWTVLVEMGGIEPPSIAVSLRLLRAQLVSAFYSAPTFATSI